MAGEDTWCVTGAAITANLMRNNSFRVDSVQKLLGPHKFAGQQRQAEREEQRECEWESERGRARDRQT